MIRAAVVVVVAMAFVAGCGGNEATYTPQQATEAFAQHGFTLVSAPEQSNLSDDVLVSDPVQFAVIAASDAEADDYWSDEEFELVARRANVVVLRFVSLDLGEIGRIRLSLEALPDSEHPVEMART